MRFETSNLNVLFFNLVTLHALFELFFFMHLLDWTCYTSLTMFTFPLLLLSFYLLTGIIVICLNDCAVSRFKPLHYAKIWRGCFRFSEKIFFLSVELTISLDLYQSRLRNDVHRRPLIWVTRMGKVPARILVDVPSQYSFRNPQLGGPATRLESACLAIANLKWGRSKFILFLVHLFIVF